MKLGRGPEFTRSAYSQFNAAAALMTVIPLLICCYLIVVRFFSLSILVGLNGVYFVLAIVLAILGILLGRRIITRVVRGLVLAEAKAHELTSVAEEAVIAERKRSVELDKAYQSLHRTQRMLVQAEKLSAIGELASGVAHEVKNPLSIILQGVNYLERDSERKPEQSEVLKMMKEAVLRADKIVRAMLDFSRQQKMELKPCEVGSIIDSAFDLVGKQLTLSNIKVTKELESDLPPVLADSNQLQQVFINLILNAVRAMPAGGQFTIRVHDKELTKAENGVGRRAMDMFKQGERAVICELNDTGRGIPKAQLGKVFDPFFTTRPEGEGTGLGLTITRSVIEAHRGLIAIESEEGQGTLVKITLPIARSDNIRRYAQPA